jgi:hypothetical protein
LKSLLRFIYYSQERAKFFREPKIKRIQEERIKLLDSGTKKLIIFLIPGADYFTGKDKISGGIMSIISLAEESVKLKPIHQAEVIVVTFPRQHLIDKHVQFKNRTDVFRYSQLQRYFHRVDEVLIHLPEYLCGYFLSLWHGSDLNWLKNVNRRHINILNQSITLMPALKDIERLKECANLVTATTAHQQYCSQKYRDAYQIPLHKFSVWISPENYFFRQYEEKENRMVVSPDEHPEKEAILGRLGTIPNLQIVVIQGLTYEQYKETIAKAKWSLTFGEGLDGYLIEPIFSGAIGFALYNDYFFTNDFANWQTLYKSTEELSNRIVSDICKLDPAENFIPYQQQQFALCAKYYSKKEYKANIASFYRKEYTYA